jgi:integrase
VATIREKRPGVWEVRVFTGRGTDGKPTQTSRTVPGGKREARRVANDLERAGQRSAPAGRTVDDALDAWIAQSLPTWAASSARDQQSRVRAVKQDPIVRVPLARLSVSDVERWHARLRRAGANDPAIRNQHTVLRAALSQAVRWGWASSNAASLARLRASKAQPRQAMSLEDVQAVLTAAATVDAAAQLALRLAAVAGVRRAELAALRWDDVRSGSLTVDSAIETVRCGDGRPALRDALTKTANVRTVALDGDTLTLIESVRAEREPYGPWMFGLGPDLVNPDHIGWWWRRSRSLARIDVKWRLHDLRHWSATVAIGQGHDVRTVAGRLGHANPALTLRVYAHAVASADRAVATSLGDALSGAG